MPSDDDTTRPALREDGNTASNTLASQTTEPSTRIVSAARWRRVVVRGFIYGGLLAGGILGGIEFWANRSYRATVADLHSLQDSTTTIPTLDEAEASVKGWVRRPFEREEKSFREDVTVRWRSIFGNYWVRLHVTKSGKRSEVQYFTGMITPDDPPMKIHIPDDVIPLPKKGPVGVKFNPNRRVSRKKTGTED